MVNVFLVLFGVDWVWIIHGRVIISESITHADVLACMHVSVLQTYMHMYLDLILRYFCYKIGCVPHELILTD